MVSRFAWVKGHEGTPGNERADVLAGKAAERKGYSRVMSLAHLKLRVSEKFRKTKTAWHDIPSHHGTEVIPPPPPKKSCLENMRNALARTAAQIRTAHWRSAVYLKRIRKMVEDKCYLVHTKLAPEILWVGNHIDHLKARRRGSQPGGRHRTGSQVVPISQPRPPAYDHPFRFHECHLTGRSHQCRPRPDHRPEHQEYGV
jgi:hypothetical protein